MRPRASAVLPIELGRMEHIMDEKTSSAPMQEDPQKGEELSFTITGEDAEAQDALNAKKPEPPIPRTMPSRTTRRPARRMRPTARPARKTPRPAATA